MRQKIRFTFNCFPALVFFIASLNTCSRQVVAAHNKGGCLEGSHNISSLLKTTTSITLKTGNYCIESYQPIANLSKLNISGESGNPEDVVIRCAVDVGLAFFNVSQQLLISGVTISGCGLRNGNLVSFLQMATEPMDMYYNVVPHCSFGVMAVMCCDVQMENTHISDNIGFGMMAINLHGNSSFTRVSFTGNQAPGDTVFSDDFLEDGRAFGGGAIFHFHDWKNTSVVPASALNVRVSVTDSRISSNVNYYSAELAAPFTDSSAVLQKLGYIVSGAAGITIKLCQFGYTVDFSVQDSLITDNHAQIGGGVVIANFVSVANSSVTFANCSISNNTNSTQVGLGMGAAVFLNLWYKNWSRSHEYDRATQILFDSCRFVGNEASTGGGLFAMYAFGIVTGLKQLVLFRNCVFHSNMATCGAAASIHAYKGAAIDRTQRIVFEGCNFTANTVSAPSTFSASLTGSGAIQLKSAYITLNNTFVKDTNGSGLESSDSSIEIAGKVEFSNNTGVFGGGAQMIGFSFFIATNHSRLIFHRNTAYQSGGGIYFILPQNILVDAAFFDCFLYFQSIDFYCINCTFKDLDFQLRFEDNTAKSGRMIHGALLDTCIWAYPLTSPYGHGGWKKPHTIETLYANYSDVFYFSEPLTPKGVNTDSTDPNVKVKLTDSHHVSVMPGQSFEVEANAVDILGSTVSDILLAFVQGNNVRDNATIVNVSVGTDGLWRVDGNSTSFVHITGLVNVSGNIGLTSTVSQATSSIDVTLTNCCAGFCYNNETSACRCDPILQPHSRNLRCFVQNASFAVRNGYWFGNLDGSSKLNSHVSDYVVTQCSSNACFNKLYAKRQDFPLRPDFSRDDSFHDVYKNDLDQQCLPNRTGLLCGKCIDGYSIQLGTLECGKCEGNAGLAFILLFAVMGVLLMAIITVSDFHVSEGYINGLVFYSNIIDIFYSSLVKRNVPYSVLTIYEWLSLRWGLRVCFIDGLDSLLQLGLEFVFPLYMGFLLLVMIVVARYCPIPQRVRKSIPFPKILATTLFLTFAAVLGTSIKILAFVLVYKVDGTLSLRWRRDPTIPYLGLPMHIVLFLVSVCAVLYLVAITTILIVPERLCKVPWLRRKQRYFKPITDAFQAPYRETYICKTWEGWRLLFRGVVLIIEFFPPSVHLWVFIGILAVFLFFQSSLHPYKGTCRNWLDSFFVLVLIVTFLFYVALESFNIGTGELQFLVPFYIVQSVMLLVVLGIFAQSFYKYIRWLFMLLKGCGKKGSSSIDSPDGFTESTEMDKSSAYSEPLESSVLVGDVRIRVQNYGSLRSGLLDYDSDDDDDDDVNKEMNNINS